jgi:hypothetical protein
MQHLAFGYLSESQDYVSLVIIIFEISSQRSYL